MISFINKEQAKDKSYILKVLESTKLPFVASDISNFEILTGGSKSVAVWIEKYIIRFPTNNDVLENQKREALISKLLHEHLPNKYRSKITDVKFANNFAYHKMLRGKVFDKKVSLSEHQKDSLANDVAHFLNALHQIPKSKLTQIDKITTPKTDNWNYTNNAEWNYETAKVLLQGNNINLDRFKTNFSDEDKVICHNDLSGSNILLDDTQDNPLQAIIDFGNVAIMPRANEFVPFYKISRNFAHKIMNYYNQISPNKVNQKEVDYMALSFIGQLLIDSRNKESSFTDLMIENFKKD
ncbi:MAG: aminoglycoside phosphotransferase family protein [Alphaproteobacteria bacterium]|nr:aminoglycoside phosphotransferase family protein [Alphaproteobacteria bacterium]